MIKKLSVDANSYDGHALCAIVSHLKDYRLAYYINNALNIKLKKYDDLTINENNISYSWYHFKNSSNSLIYYLVANHHPDGKFIPVQNVDYFLFLKNIFEDQQKEMLISKLRKVNDIIMIFEQDMQKVKKMDAIHEAIEFHELEQVIAPLQKNKKRRPLNF